MAIGDQSDLPSNADRFTTWFPDFLRKELAPYPGRRAVVARMVIAATITTILISAIHSALGSPERIGRALVREVAQPEFFLHALAGLDE